MRKRPFPWRELKPPLVSVVVPFRRAYRTHILPRYLPKWWPIVKGPSGDLVERETAWLFAFYSSHILPPCYNAFALLKYRTFGATKTYL
jgi:hypothetical protein